MGFQSRGGGWGVEGKGLVSGRGGLGGGVMRAVRAVRAVRAGMDWNP